MRLTVRDALVYALENLEKMGFKKFRKQLHEMEVKENYRRIPRGKLEDKDRGDIADLIREYYKDVYGAEVTLAVLDKINEKKVAEELEEDLRKVDRFVQLNALEESRCLAPKAKPMTLHLSNTGEMMCSITLETFYPGYLHTEWKCGGEKSSEVLLCQELYKESPDHGSFSVCSEVRISQDSLTDPESTVHISWEHEYTNTKGRQTFSLRNQATRGAEYICEVEHPSLEKAIKKSTGGVKMLAKPQLEPIGKTLDSLFVDLSLHLKSFYPKEVKVKWYQEKLELSKGVKQMMVQTETVTEREDSLFDVICKCRVLRLCFEDPKYKVYLTWEHESMEGPETRTLSVRDLPWIPNVGVIYYLPVRANVRTKLRCPVSNYFPDALTVSWYKKENGIMSEVQNTSEMGTMVETYENTKYMYVCIAILYFTPKAEKDEGSEFICRVEHPSLEHPIERSTGPLRIL
ncbi:uncharacterized protein [Dendropsophus ebraccatus]|uniref:uncharacterized protein n=1 Tax=Dendropsophus ebraccatus TaxID=150705 RepID=UPI00383152DC